MKEQYNPKIKVIAVMPLTETPIPGLKNFPEASYTPKIWDSGNIDEIQFASFEKAEEIARLTAFKEGLFVGPSSDAILHLTLKTAEKLDSGVLVAIAPDGGERYLSTTLCTPELCLECAQKYNIKFVGI